MTRNVRTTVLAHFEQVAAEQRQPLAPLSDDRPLVEAGLDSLAFAVLVARLEDELGIDPFAPSEGHEYPVTVGDFIQMYEKSYANVTTSRVVAGS